MRRPMSVNNEVTTPSRCLPQAGSDTFELRRTGRASSSSEDLRCGTNLLSSCFFKKKKKKKLIAPFREKRDAGSTPRQAGEWNRASGEPHVGGGDMPTHPEREPHMYLIQPSLLLVVVGNHVD